MKSLLSLLMVLGSIALLTISAVTPAEAKRLGSGSSFGSKFSYSNNVKKSPASSPSKQAQTPSQQQNFEQKQKFASKGGLMGILGGLAIGGLLGALFFGGAFENINFLDILIFALIGFVLFKLFTSRSRQAPATAQGPSPQEFSTQEAQYSAPETTTSGQTQSASVSSFGGITLDELRSEISRDFDKSAFLDGAKSCYARLQNAWDEGDLADIRQFTTDHVFAEIQEQLKNHQAKSETKILSLNAELISARQLGEAMEATVLFEARLVEDGDESTVNEVWHFVRSATSLTPTWHLDGIQQVED